MTKNIERLLLRGLLLLIIGTVFFCRAQTLSPLTENEEKEPILYSSTVEWKGAAYLVVEVAPEALQFFLENKAKEKFRSFESLDNYLKDQGQELLFAMNGGMYLPAQDNEPQGLYIERGIVRKALEPLTKHRPIKTNFYLHPNGVFYIQKDGQAVVQSNTAFQAAYPSKEYEQLQYTTQSGPMLVLNKQLHPAFTPNSNNIHFRNAVGILPNGNVVLVLSKKRICFHDMATLFRDQLGCANALYLDGFVSRVYYPALEDYQEQQQGNFGVIIGVTNK